MKRKLTQIAIILLGAVLTLFTVIELTYIERGYTRLMGFYGLEKDSIDLAVVGTSVTFSSYMPMDAWARYGIASYNYSTNVQFENVFKYSLKDILRTQNPKLILIDVSPFILGHYPSNPEWTEGYRRFFISYNLDSRRYTPDRFALVSELNRATGGDFRSYWTYFFDITRCHTRKPDFSQFNNAVNDPARGYGYLEHNKGGEILPETFLSDDGSTCPLSPLEQGYFDELIGVAKTLDSEVVFLCPPIYFDDTREYGVKNSLKAQAENEGFGFIDLSGEGETIGLDHETDLWSNDHFDSLGAEKITAFLSDYLHAHYELPDRREDPAYASWHTDYETWLGLKASYLEQDRTGKANVTGEEILPPL